MSQRRAEEWVQREFGRRIRMLNPDDPQGPTIVWSRTNVYLDEQLVGTQTCHTYVSDFLAHARDLIQDVVRCPDDAAVHHELRDQGLVPPA